MKYRLFGFPLSLLLIFFIVLALYFQAEKNLKRTLVQKGTTLIEALHPAFLNAIKFSLRLDDERDRVLLSISDLLSEKPDISTSSLLSLSVRYNLFEITLLNKEKKVLQSTHRKKWTKVSDSLIEKAKMEEIEGDTLYFYTTTHFGGILFLRDISSLKSLKREFGVKKLLESVARDPDIEYFLMESDEGIVFSSENIRDLSSLKEDVFLQRSMQSEKPMTREIRVQGEPILEITKSVLFENAPVGLIRMGISLEDLKDLQNKMLFFLFLVLLSLIIFTGFLFAYILLGKKNESLSLRNLFLNNLKDIIVENSEEGILLTDQNGKIIYVNRNFKDLTHTDDIIDKNYNRIFPEDEFGVNSCLRNKGKTKFEKRKDERCYEIQTRFIKRETGYCIVQIRDITEVKEKEIKEKETERFKGMTEFLGGLAHEIKNPLNVMHLSLINVEKELGEEKVQEIRESYIKIKEMVEEFLNILKPIVYSREPFEINKVIQEIINEFREEFTSSGIKTSVNGDKASITGDRNKIKKALMNLIKNSIEAQEEGGKISINIQKKGDKIIVSVEDRGQGISKENLQKIFTPYFSTKEKGTGLGLFIVKKIIEDHNGKIYVESKLGYGTKFTIVLSR